MSRPEQHSIGRRIGSLHRRIRQYIDREFEEHGIGHDTLPFLSLVLSRNGGRQRDMAELLCVDKATAARAMAKLEKFGYVQRKRDPADGRALVVRPGKKAKALETHFRRKLRKLTDILARGFTASERATAIGLLERMEENLARAADSAGNPPPLGRTLPS